MGKKAISENESTYTDTDARQILEALFLIEDFFRYGVRCEHEISLEASASAKPSSENHKATLEALKRRSINAPLAAFGKVDRRSYSARVF